MGGIRSLRLSDILVLNLKQKNYIREYIYNRYFQKFFFENLCMCVCVRVAGGKLKPPLIPPQATGMW